MTPSGRIPAFWAYFRPISFFNSTAMNLKNARDKKPAYIEEFLLAQAGVFAVIYALARRL